MTPNMQVRPWNSSHYQILVVREILMISTSIENCVAVTVMHVTFYYIIICYFSEKEIFIPVTITNRHLVLICILREKIIPTVISNFNNWSAFDRPFIIYLWFIFWWSYIRKIFWYRKPTNVCLNLDWFPIKFEFVDEHETGIWCDT